MDLLEKPFAPTDYLKVAQYLRDRRNISLRLNDDDLDPLLRARMQETGLLWIVEVPIVSRDEVLGLVRLGDTRFDRTLSDSEVQVIETLINQAAVAMSNARLYDQILKFTQELEGRVEERTRELARANEDLKAERDQVETLFRIASELSTSLDLDRVLNRALELVVRAAGATHGSILAGRSADRCAGGARGAGRRSRFPRWANSRRSGAAKVWRAGASSIASRRSCRMCTTIRAGSSTMSGSASIVRRWSCRCRSATMCWARCCCLHPEPELLHRCAFAHGVGGQFAGGDGHQQCRTVPLHP